MWRSISVHLGCGLLTFALLLSTALPLLADPVQDAKDVLRPFHKEFFGLVGERKFEEARKLAEAALKQYEREYQRQPLVIAIVLENLAALYEETGSYQEAIPLYRHALAIKEKELGAEHMAVAETAMYLANSLRQTAQYSEAQTLLERSLAINEKHQGPSHPQFAYLLNKLAQLNAIRGYESKVEPLLKRAIDITERQNEPDLEVLANSLESLGGVYYGQGRLAEAEALFRRCYEIRRKTLKPNDLGYIGVPTAMENLANIHWSRGRYSEAEPLFKRALAITEEIAGPEHHWVTSMLQSLAGIYMDQGRFAEAEPLYRRSLNINQKWFGAEHPTTATSCNNLAELYRQMGRLDEAEQLCRQALTVREKVLGPEHIETAYGLNELGLILAAQHRYAHAEPDYQRSIAIAERALGPNAPFVAYPLKNLVDLYCEMGKFADAEPLADRVIRIRDTAMVSPGERSTSYAARARISWALGRKSEAVADLKQALDLAEEQRGNVSGAEHERAAAFAEFTRPFEQMVAWQLELGDFGEALSAMERARARSLLDEMNIEGADLSLARSAEEREQLQAEESKLQVTVASLEEQLAHAAAGDRPRLEQALSRARAALYDHYRDERNSNPVYRNLLSGGSGAPRLSQLQRTVAAPDALVLVYLVGTDGGYLLSIDASSARLSKLELNAAQAKMLGVEPGPLNADRLAGVLVASKAESLLPQLSSAAKAPQLSRRLAALCESLIPAADRQGLTTGKYKRLVVVPDGSLSLLPFETLVVENADEPKYLLDAGPPIQYAPSATVLYNLLERSPSNGKSGKNSVLTVGDPAYPVADRVASTSTPSSGTRYRAAGGVLQRLPYSGTESRWVARNFQQQGFEVVDLVGPQATEQNVRSAVSGRRILHLACHGLTDQSYGNFFGALALAPGNGGASDAANDGFLSLPEIYGLDLSHCELAILSACQTNYGPQQKGEGVWALSRGFLVAGAKRVVASNWLVDDEAAASLVSYFAAGIAQPRKSGEAIDYAAALHAAKKWVRQQEKWQDPYYWGTFVLVGPK